MGQGKGYGIGPRGRHRGHAARGEGMADGLGRRWQAQLFGEALGPVREKRGDALDDLVAAGHATRDDYWPYRIWPIVPAQVVTILR